ncbi:hypothetical protein ACLI4Q_01690 [Natrialbaceae archaeon A-CW1-1]
MAQRLGRSVSKVLEKVLREPPTMEHVLLVLFLVTGVYMYVGAANFSPAAAEFPRRIAAATALLSFLILARNYLRIVAPVVTVALGLYALYIGANAFTEDGSGVVWLALGIALLCIGIVFRNYIGESAESFVAEPMQVLGEEDIIEDDEDDDQSDEQAETEESGAMYVYDIDDPKGPVVTGILCIGYMLLTFTIGMLYATPLFVIAWTLWVKMDRAKAVALVLISFVCAYLFYELIQSDIAEGWVTGFEPPPPDVLLELLIRFLSFLNWGVWFV